MKLRKIYYILMLLLASNAFAKRAAPLLVEPIIHNGMIYSTVPWALDNGTKQNGGFIRATDKSTGQVIWEKQIYKTKYKRGLETGVQDVFITSIKLTDDASSLVIKNELNDDFNVLLQ